MFVVTPSNAESFVMFTDGVMGNSNGLDPLIQKYRRNFGEHTRFAAGDFLNGNKINPGLLLELGQIGCQLKSPVLVRTSWRGYSRLFP
jgi:hypothetical protein